jgi:hypothetical protein
MFYPQAMTEVDLIIPAKDLLEVTKVLAGQGIFHQMDASYLSSDTEPDSVDSWPGSGHHADFRCGGRPATGG